VLERRQDLAFRPEAVQDGVRVEAAPYEFDRHRLDILAVGADGLIDDADAAAADFANQGV